MLAFCVFNVILKMSDQDGLFRHIMLFYFKQSKNAAQTKVKVLIDTNPRYTTQEIADVFYISKTSIENYSID